jgi:hypothetical protein
VRKFVSRKERKKVLLGKTQKSSVENGAEKFYREERKEVLLTVLFVNTSAQFE